MSSVISEILAPMVDERRFGEVMTQMGVDSTGREGKNLRRNIEKKRDGVVASTLIDVLALKCMREVAEGRLRMEDYEEQVSRLIPKADDYRDERLHRWALTYVVYRLSS